MSCPYVSVNLAPGFYAIEENGVRSFLFEGDKEAVLIDTGFGNGDLKAFIATLTPLPVTKVINTHADMDHLGCNHQFDCILMHPAEFDRYFTDGKHNGDIVLPLWEGDVISVGEYNLEVILIPGHTPGSIALLERKKRFLIGGDSVQDGAIFMFGAGRCMPAFVHSMEKLEKLSKEFDVVYPSHGSLTVTPDILPLLRQGALDVMEGKIAELPPIWEGMPCKLYDCRKVKFLYA